jgi:hypothetical protein
MTLQGQIVDGDSCQFAVNGLFRDLRYAPDPAARTVDFIGCSAEREAGVPGRRWHNWRSSDTTGMLAPDPGSEQNTISHR